MSNSTEIQASSQPTFNFGEHAVRVVLRDGEPWFVASDVCGALLYKNTSDAIATHLDDDERSTIANSESRNGGGSLVVISESGLYALVLRSRKPEARKFAKWVTSEVLPAIRKTGKYEKPQTQKTTTILRTASVQFYGATLHVIEHDGQPVTPLKSIAQAIGLDWNGLAWTVVGNEARWGLIELPQRGSGEPSLLCMPVRKVGAWLAGIETGKIKDRAVRAQAIRYQNECDDALWKCWSESMPPARPGSEVVIAPQYKPLAPGKMIVDRVKLAAIWTDLGKLRTRLDGLGVLASDLPPAWWQEHAISQ